MSSIDKLLIRGIRSFSPYDENVIEFYTPLTVIVGHNGAGKTTIIECLKYATCGDLPPNSKGGAFVHDPKVSREVEVKGQIKLKFKNVRGQTMVCTRSLQSTQRRLKLEQKTLESLLATTDPRTGEQVSISSRCAEMDVEIPIQLGVSRAVLENVLFCHQEESFWPLSEPGILKKKFDDIFAATRYTKALDTLKSLRKELAAELKLEQQKLDYLKADKEKAARLELEIEKTEIRRREGQGRIDVIETQLGEIQAVIERLSQDLQNLSDLQGELERVEHDIQITRRSQADLSAGISVLEEPDDVLAALLEQYSRRTLAGEGTLDKMRSEKGAIDAQITELSSVYHAKSTEIGVLQAELSRLAVREASKMEALLKACGELNVPNTGYFAEMAVAAKKVVAGRHGSLEAVQAEGKKVETALIDAQQAISLKISSAAEVKRMKCQAIEEAQRKLAAIRAQTENVASSQAQLDGLQGELMEEEANLDQSRKLYTAADYEGRLQVLTLRRSELGAELALLNAQVAANARFASVRAKLDVKRLELCHKRELGGKMLNEIEADLGPGVSLESAETKGEALWREKEKQLRELQERHEGAHQTFAMTSSKYEHAKSLLDRKQCDLEDKWRRLQQVCGDEGLVPVLEEAESECNRLAGELTTLLASRTTYEAFSASFAGDHACPLCERPFETSVDGEAFSHKLSKFLEALPANVLEVKERKREWEDKLGVLKGLRSISDDVDRLRCIELPGLSDELKALEGECGRAKLALEEMTLELSELAKEEKRLAAVRRHGEEAGKLIRDMSLLSKDVERLEEELCAGGADANVDAQSIQERLAAANAAQQRVLQNVDALNGEMQTRSHDLQTRETHYRDLKEQIMKIQLMQSDLLRLEQNRIELESILGGAHSEAALIDAELASLDEEHRRASARKVEAMAQMAQRELEAKTLAARGDSLYREYCSIDDEVTRLQGTCSHEILQRLVDDRQAMDGRLQGLQRDLDVVSEKIAVFGKSASESVVQERNIRDNLKCRELDRRAASLEDETRRIRGRLGTFDRGSTAGQLQRSELRHSDLMGERSGICGELRTLADQGARLQQELDTDYADTASAYRQQYVRHVAMTTAIEDLDKYSVALDQAIIKFHSHKMAEVNRIIREIWTSTYQGADIDTIEMRTEAEGTGRSYNYRLVMLKGDTELDMRGRSSAGQRVLASLIIRLALAETFGQHCGVLALDEPTTNLDRDNIESLAGSLAEIIKMRQRQGNFQLIIITHDEEFVDLLGRHECADYYWRVGKDENQYSTIERQSFQGVP